MNRLEHLAVNSAIALLGGAAIALKALEAAEAWVRWKTDGKPLD